MSMSRKPPPPHRLSENQVLQVAVQHHKNGNLKDAKDLYRLILSNNPRNADVIHRLGTMALQVEHYEKAEDYIGQAIKIGPATATMYINFGTALRNLERYDDAIAAFDAALKLEPMNADALFNKGRSLISNKQFSEAIEVNSRAIELNPTDAEAWVNLGAAQKAKGQRLESLYTFDRATRIDPDQNEAYHNMGTILLEMRMIEAGILLYKKALSIDPSDLSNRYFLSANQLLVGHFTEGWEDFDVRFEKFEKEYKMRRLEPPPFWDGSDLKGKRILIWTEQGIGEQLLAISVLSEFLLEADECIVECWERLVPIFKRSFPDVSFIPFEEHENAVTSSEKPFDYQTPALNLLSRYRNSFDDFPVRESFIQPDPNLRNHLRAKYEEMAQGRRIVGISWMSTSEVFQAVKSAELLDWHVIIESPDLFVVNLQYGEYDDDVAEYKSTYTGTIYDDPEIDPMAGLEQAMAQIAAMDLVISISNSNVHMAGAIGVPTWLLLPNTTSIIWHWFLDRTDSPWYPSVRVFRQNSVLDQEGSWWVGVLDQVCEALGAWMSEPLPPRIEP
jgi:tetratricopeptide (TPR) repeat protein